MDVGKSRRRSDCPRHAHDIALVNADFHSLKLFSLAQSRLDETALAGKDGGHCSVGYGVGTTSSQQVMVSLVVQHIDQIEWPMHCHVFVALTLSCPCLIVVYQCALKVKAEKRKRALETS